MNNNNYSKYKYNYKNIQIIQDGGIFTLEYLNKKTEESKEKLKKLSEDKVVDSTEIMELIKQLHENQNKLLKIIETLGNSVDRATISNVIEKINTISTDIDELNKIL
jgi:predicted ATPase